MNKLKYLAALVIGIAALGMAQNASAARYPLPTVSAQVPDGGTTVMLLGAALGALGMARGFLKK